MEKITKTDNKNIPVTLDFENGNIINLEGLPEEMQNELRKQQASTCIELQKKAQELGIETITLSKRMNDSINNVAKATADGTSATVTGVYKDTMGHTEFIVGNTETAQKGKITSEQRGKSDPTLMYVIIGIVTIIILITLLKS